MAIDTVFILLCFIRSIEFLFGNEFWFHFGNVMTRFVILVILSIPMYKTYIKLKEQSVVVFGGCRVGLAVVAVGSVVL